MKSSPSEDPTVDVTPSATRPLVPLPLRAKAIPQATSLSSTLSFEAGERMQEDVRRPMPLPLAVATDVRRPMPLPLAVATEPISSQSSDYRPMPLPGGGLPIEPRRPVPLPLERDVEPISSQSTDYRPMPLPGNGLAQLESRKPVPMPLSGPMLQQTEPRKIVPLPLRLLSTPEDSTASGRPDLLRSPPRSQVGFDFTRSHSMRFTAQFDASSPVPLMSPDSRWYPRAAISHRLSPVRLYFSTSEGFPSATSTRTHIRSF